MLESIGGEHCKPTADSRMEAEGGSGGGFRQSEMESEIATAYNHALAIPLQLAQLNLQSPPTGAGCYFENSITGESSGQQTGADSNITDLSVLVAGKGFVKTFTKLYL